MRLYIVLNTSGRDVFNIYITFQLDDYFRQSLKRGHLDWMGYDIVRHEFPVAFCEKRLEAVLEEYGRKVLWSYYNKLFRHIWRSHVQKQ